MATTSSTGDKPEFTVVTVVPPSLDKALLLMVKNFFGEHQFLIVYYIMKAVCIREENLRKKLQFDQRDLRQKLVALKQEKLVKERLVQQKNENGRSVSIIFYFINYRAIMNVLKYKIDHMRQKLEAKEQEDTQRAIYRCTGCGSMYETLEVDRILDRHTGMLVCWRCQGEVTQDESGGPTQATRTLVARFNEQMRPLFTSIQELAGIQLAPFLLEPDINQYMAEEDRTENQLQSLDFSGQSERVSLGGKSFSNHRGPATIQYSHGDEITVDLNADLNNKPMEEAKQVPVWLQDDAITQGSEHAQAAAALSSEIGTKEDTKHTVSAGVSMHLLQELEGAASREPPAKKTKVDEEQPAEDEEEDDEEEETFMAQGQRYKLSELTPEIIETMTEDEKKAYIEASQDMYDF